MIMKTVCVLCCTFSNRFNHLDFQRLLSTLLNKDQGVLSRRDDRERGGGGVLLFKNTEPFSINHNFLTGNQKICFLISSLHLRLRQPPICVFGQIFSLDPPFTVNRNLFFFAI
jgi:hypothetical protein